MRNLSKPVRRRASDLDDATLDRLLSGAVEPADAPPGYASVAAALSALAAPPSPSELAGEEALHAAFHAANRPAIADPPRRDRMTRTSRIVLVAAASVFALGGLAAAAASGGSDSSEGAKPPEVTTTAAGGTTTLAAAPSSAQGPDVTGPAKFGLCNAYASGQGTANGGKADSTAFTALATAAGTTSSAPDAATKIAAFCADALPGNHTTPPGPPEGAGPDGSHGNTTSATAGENGSKGDENGTSHKP